MACFLFSTFAAAWREVYQPHPELIVLSFDLLTHSFHIVNLPLFNFTLAICDVQGHASLDTVRDVWPA